MAMTTVQGKNVLQLLSYHDCNSDWVDRRLFLSQGAVSFQDPHKVCVGASSHQGGTSVKSSPNMFVKVVEVTKLPETVLSRMHPNITDFPNMVLRTERLWNGKKIHLVSHRVRQRKTMFFRCSKWFVEVFLLLLKDVMHMNYTLSHSCWAKSNLFNKNNTSFTLSKSWLFKGSKEVPSQQWPVGIKQILMFTVGLKSELEKATFWVFLSSFYLS